jgi:NAD(P)H dehydrogenase (quinone)
MPKIVISGASGDVGRRVTRELLDHHELEELRLVTRSPAKLAGTVPASVRVFEGDYNRPDLLENAYRGADVLLLISGTAITQRVEEHRRAIAAAKAAGIKTIVYTSYVGIHPQNPNLAAIDHRGTERDLMLSGIPYVILRDATYAEMAYEICVAPALQSGRWITVKGEGRLALVAKADVVRCLARCLVDHSFHAGAVYEISGAELMTFAQMAQLAMEVFDAHFEVLEITPEQRLAYWDSLGVPRDRSGAPAHANAEWLASDELVSGERAMAEFGYQGVLSDHVWFITGRRPTPLREVWAGIARNLDAKSLLAEISQRRPAAQP